MVEYWRGSRTSWLSSGHPYLGKKGRYGFSSSKGKLVGVELGLGEENGRSSCVAIEMVVKLSNVQEIGYAINLNKIIS